MRLMCSLSIALACTQVVAACGGSKSKDGEKATADTNDMLSRVYSIASGVSMAAVSMDHADKERGDERCKWFREGLQLMIDEREAVDRLADAPGISTCISQFSKAMHAFDTAAGTGLPDGCEGIDAWWTNHLPALKSALCGVFTALDTCEAAAKTSGATARAPLPKPAWCTAPAPASPP